MDTIIKNYSYEELKELKFDKSVKTLEDNILFAMKWYPSLFNGKDARMKVLIHILLQGGTGFDWRKGIRKTCYESTDKQVIDQKKSSYEYNKKSAIDRLKMNNIHIEGTRKFLETFKNDSKFSEKVEQSEKSLLEQETLLERTEKFIEEFDPHYEPYNFTPSTIKGIDSDVGYFNLDDIPSNIKTDYFNGLLEVFEFYSQDCFLNDENYTNAVSILAALKERVR
tara:strand:- start:220 stop:891 length:672 start_codon:yes stop_codon:yes gene_type:complete